MTGNALPPRLAARPFDTRRGLPVPYVSEHDDGIVDFSLINGTRVLDCVRRGLCSACGQPHEPQIAFVGGPGGFGQRRYTDAPMHLECAQWSLRLCPYLAVERHQRRGLTEQTAAPGFTQMEKADPVILAVTTGCRVELLHEAGYAPTVQFRPALWIWATRYEYRHGRLVEVGPQPLPSKQKRRPPR